jgi:cation transport ATPase
MRCEAPRLSCARWPGDVVPGDVLVLYPHEICPVDGTVVEGNGSMEESFLTGEPFRMSKAPGTEVLSGAINGETALTNRSWTRSGRDCRYLPHQLSLKATH